MVFVPTWAVAGILITGLIPANVLYDSVWGLIRPGRFKWYILEAVTDASVALIFILAASSVGVSEMGVAVIGMAGCVLVKGTSMVIVGSQGLSEEQKVPEWWVYVATLALVPLFLLDSAGPVIAYLLRDSF